MASSTSAPMPGSPSSPSLSESALGERGEGDEGDPGIGADVDEAIGQAVSQIIAVLDRHDFRYRSCARKLGRRDVRYADLADLALALKVDEGADRILDRDTVIDGMKLESSIRSSRNRLILSAQ